MRTPAGHECKYFYGNYFRGRKHEECRLVKPAHEWKPKLCETCPVPRILLANECPYMLLQGSVKNMFFGIRKEVQVSAYCEKSEKAVTEPEVGCGECHPLPEVFLDETS